MHDFSPGTEEGGIGPPENPRPANVLWKTLRVVALVWFGLVLVLAISQRSMTYFPMTGAADTLAREAIAADLEPWTNPGGEIIGYRHLPSPEDPRPRAAFLILHGNAGYAAHRGDLARLVREALPDRAVSTYILEYPGYGARRGSPSQDSLLQAASEAVALIPSTSPLFLVGESLGTGVASATAAAHPARIAGLLLLAPFDSLANVAQFHYPLLPVRWIMLDQYPSMRWLENYPGRSVFVLAENDTIVPPPFGKKLYETFAGAKLLLIAGQSDHNDLVHSLTQAEWRQALHFLLKP